MVAVQQTRAVTHKVRDVDWHRITPPLTTEVRIRHVQDFDVVDNLTTVKSELRPCWTVSFSECLHDIPQYECITADAVSKVAQSIRRGRQRERHGQYEELQSQFGRPCVESVTGRSEEVQDQQRRLAELCYVYLLWYHRCVQLTYARCLC